MSDKRSEDAFAEYALPSNQDGIALAFGVTKRELFAAMAMQAFITTDSADGSYDSRSIALAAIMCADDLLAELAK